MPSARARYIMLPMNTRAFPFIHVRACNLILNAMALQYPGPTDALNDLPQYQALVIWLEDTIIRYHAPEQRAGLRSHDPTTWQAAFDAYISELVVLGPQDAAAGGGGAAANTGEEERVAVLHYQQQ